MQSSVVTRGRGGVLGGLLMAVIVVLYALLPTVTRAQEPHYVREGDTLSAIADAYGLSVRELVWLNGLDDPDLIFPGEWIALGPSDTSPTTAGEDAAPATSNGADALPAVDAQLDVTPSAAVELAPPAALPEWVDRETVRTELVVAASKWGWDPYLIMALAWQESGWRQDEVSGVGAIGVMQVMPDTAAELDAWLFQRGADPWNSVWDNIETGVAFLTCLYQESGDVELAIGSYYQGWGSVQRDGFFPDTRAYVDNILYMRDLFAAGELP